MSDEMPFGELRIYNIDEPIGGGYLCDIDVQGGDNYTYDGVRLTTAEVMVLTNLANRLSQPEAE